jgi:hypothetical protein
VLHSMHDARCVHLVQPLLSAFVRIQCCCPMSTSKSTPIAQLSMPSPPSSGTSRHISPDIVQDDDEAIRSVLSAIENPQPTSAPHKPTDAPIVSVLQPPAYVDAQNAQNYQLYHAAQLLQRQELQRSFGLLHLLNHDAKLAVLVVLAVLLSGAVPLERLASAFVALERIPYHATLLRAGFAALVVLLLKRVVL